MAAFAIVVGLLLSLLGFGFYAGLAAVEHATPSVTALIPAFVGIPVFVLGCVALKDAARKHAMHAVALLALLGFLLPTGRLAMQWAKGESVSATALSSLVLMAALCGFLLAGCIRSFVRARLAAANGGD